jgi:hypothetical protein
MIWSDDATDRSELKEVGGKQWNRCLLTRTLAPFLGFPCLERVSVHEGVCPAWSCVFCRRPRFTSKLARKYYHVDFSLTIFGSGALVKDWCVIIHISLSINRSKKAFVGLCIIWLYDYYIQAVIITAPWQDSSSIKPAFSTRFYILHLYIPHLLYPQVTRSSIDEPPFWAEVPSLIS